MSNRPRRGFIRSMLARGNGHSDLWFEHLCGATSGTSTLSAPPQPGQYEFRYMVGDTAVARSGPVTVSASASPLVLVPTLSVDGGTASSRQIGQTFWYTEIPHLSPFCLAL